MNRFVRIVGILGAVGAIIWAMRDRFISLTVPKEPEPPAFRHPSQPPAPPAQRSSALPPSAIPSADVAEPDDLTDVNGIGPVFAQRLTDAGVTSFAALAAMSADQLKETLGSRLGKVDTILDDARRLAGT